MSLIVQKFGGTSVADTERLKNVADIVTSTAKAGNQVVVVVSAQGDTTDDLIEKAAELNERPSRREMDVLLNTGEMISMSLLAMAIQKLGFPVVSLTGWQIGMETNSNYSDARIKRISGDRLKAELDNGRIVIVAGFQGINKMGDVTTLGRGGSDTTAVAIAATLGADLCQIYTDVDGVYTADPRIVKNARKLDGFRTVCGIVHRRLFSVHRFDAKGRSIKRKTAPPPFWGKLCRIFCLFAVFIARFFALSSADTSARPPVPSAR